MDDQPTTPSVWTFLPGLHGTEELYSSMRDKLPPQIVTEFVNLPSSGKQDYQTLCQWLNNELPQLPEGQKRIIIAESFSGPLAIQFASQQRDSIAGLALVASFCDTPLNPGIALLPLRPLFMVKPPRKALRHFLIGEDAGESQITELRNVIRATSSATISKRIRAILQLEESDTPQLPGLPMLILQAHNDNLIPWEAQSKLEACYPDAHAHWIDSPHLLFQRCPDACIEHLSAFAKNIANTQTEAS